MLDLKFVSIFSWFVYNLVVSFLFYFFFFFCMMSWIPPCNSAPCHQMQILHYRFLNSYIYRVFLTCFISYVVGIFSTLHYKWLVGDLTSFSIRFDLIRFRFDSIRCVSCLLSGFNCWAFSIQLFVLDFISVRFAIFGVDLTRWFLISA